MGVVVTDVPKRKLIEVALPLEAINRESAREKSIRHGHPSTLHLWSDLEVGGLHGQRALERLQQVVRRVTDPADRPHHLSRVGAHAEERPQGNRPAADLARGGGAGRRARQLRVTASPLVAIALIGTAFIDQIDRRRLAQATTCGQAATGLLMAAVAGWSGDRVWPVLVLAGISSGLPAAVRWSSAGPLAWPGWDWWRS
jgi:hypothetical protein